MSSGMDRPPLLQSLRELYRRAADRHPLVAPHAESAFETLDTLGQGGMGRVLRIRDKRLGREAALKLLSKNDKPRARQRFIREARVTARLSHPSIPPIFEAGETAEGQLYLLMKLIEGQTFGALINRAHRRAGEARKAEIRELLEALVRTCEAIDFAHSAGVIHRDLKPENLMVGKFGEVMVMDWGIARDFSESFQTDNAFAAELGGGSSVNDAASSERLTRSGAILGTLGFMAPEQARGEDVDARSDLFSLGVILTEALTGQAAIHGDTAAALFAATINGGARSPRALDPAVSPELDFIARRCLALEPEERYRNAGELRAALKAVLEDRPVPGFPYSPLARGLRAARRRPGLLLAGMLGLSLLTLLALFDRELKARRLAEVQAQRASEALTVSKSREAEASTRARQARRVLELLNQARDQARRGAPRTALSACLEDALRTGERAEEVLLAAAEIAAEGELAELQQSLLLEVTRRFPPGYEALLSLHVLATDGDISRGSRYKEQIIAAARSDDKTNEFTLASLALEAFQTRRYLETIALCDQGEAFSRKMWILYHLRGCARSKLGQYEAARSDQERAAELQPRNPIVLCNRGVSRLELGDARGARQDFLRAMELAPNDGPILAAWGAALAQRGQSREGLRYLDRAIAVDPKDPRSHYNRGMAREDLGDTRGARADYDKTIALDPNYAEAYNNRGLLRERRGDAAGALADYNRSLELYPANAFAFFNRGSLRARRGQAAAALADFDRAIALRPGQPRMHNNRGLARLETGDLSGAVADFSRALELDPNNMAAYANRGQALIRLGQKQQGLDDLRQALRRAPEGPFKTRLAARVRALEQGKP